MREDFLASRLQGVFDRWVAADREFASAFDALRDEMASVRAVVRSGTLTRHSGELLVLLNKCLDALKENREKDTGEDR